MANKTTMSDPAAEGEAAARRDAQHAKDEAACKNAARTIALDAIERLTNQLTEVAQYLVDDEFLSALGTLQGFEEKTKNILAAERLLRMVVLQ